MGDWNAYWDALSKIRPLYAWMQRSQVKQYKSLLCGRLPKNPRIMEFGAGTGMLATQLLDEYGGAATLVDYSESAERLHRKMHKKKRDDVEYLIADVFSTSFKPEYDVVYSDGLIEHFKGAKQDELVRKHATASKRLVVIFAPRPSLFYSTTRALLELTGLWLFGYEKPMTLGELSSLCERNGMRVLASESGLWESGVLCEKKPAHKVQKHR